MEPQDVPAEAERTIRYRERWGFKFPGVLWWVALLIVPIIFAALVSAYNRSSIEVQLTDQSIAALAKAGITDIHVVFEARDATLDIPFGVSVTAAQMDAAVEIVEGIEGVRIVVANRESIEGAGSSLRGVAA